MARLLPSSRAVCSNAGVQGDACRHGALIHLYHWSCCGELSQSSPCTCLPVLRVEYVELSGVQVRILHCFILLRRMIRHVHANLMPRLQHGFILPENLRPCRLIGNGTAGVVLCCKTERGAMVAVKKIRSDTELGLQRSLREVGLGPRL